LERIKQTPMRAGARPSSEAHQLQSVVNLRNFG
jgi:hypothetical protein